MKVYHFSTFTSGGAAIAARRLHDSLHTYGVRSIFYYGPWARGVSADTYRRFEPIAKKRMVIVDRLHGTSALRLIQAEWLGRYLNGRPEGYEQFSYARSVTKTPLGFDGDWPDIIHLHWVADWLDYPSFFRSIPDNLPIVWTLHDMNAFTGGCHYAWECDRYRDKCGDCPQLNKNRSPNDLSHRNWCIKWASIRTKNLHVVGDSRWLEQRARESKLLSNARSFRTVHYGLDIQQFYPKNRVACRQALSLPEDAFVVCFGADAIDNRRKGLRELLLALSGLQETRLRTVTFGDSALEGVEHAPPATVHVGRVNSAELLSLVYSCADIFVMPSLYEAFGQTALEAMACGIPVVGSETGDIPDIIRTGETGLLAHPGDSADLAEKIRWMAEHPDERKRMGRCARQVVEGNFTSELQAETYLELYHRIAGPKA